MADYEFHFGHFLDMAAGLRFEDLGPATVSRTERVVFDTIGAMLSGSLEPENRAMVRRLPAASGRAATAFAEGFPATDALWAAFFNATEVVFLEMDEHHRPTGHPGSHVVPSALARAEAEDCSGRELITAIVAGYDLAARLANGCTLRDFMHCHGHMGATGAALANGKLLGFDREHLRQAVHVAAGMPLFSSWEPCFEGATVRNTYTGVAAGVGILAAELAGSGFTGLSNALEHTFGELVGSHLELSALDEDLAAPFQIDTDMFKFHACCAMNHPPVEALLKALNGRRLDSRDIDHIDLRVTARSMRLDRLPAPKQLSAKFSIPFAVATTVFHGHAHPEAFRDEKAADPAILDLAGRVHMIPDEELTARWPKDGGADIQVFLKDGEVLHGHVDNPYGWLTEPSTDQDLVDKFSLLNAELYTPQQAQQIFELCDQLADAPSISQFIQRLKDV